MRSSLHPDATYPDSATALKPNHFDARNTLTVVANPTSQRKGPAPDGACIRGAATDDTLVPEAENTRCSGFRSQRKLRAKLRRGICALSP